MPGAEGDAVVETRPSGRQEEQEDQEEEESRLLRTRADPRLEELDEIEGYGRIGLPGEFAYQPAPRSAEGFRFDQEAGVKTFEQLPKITEEIARDVLYQYASEHCCRGKNFIRQLPITKIETTLAWHYELTSFLEARYTCWTYEPYVGQEVDGRANGKPPKPWEVGLRPSEMFADQDEETIVPHTGVLKPCHHCLQNGSIACGRCKGECSIRCADCGGQGRRLVVQGAVSRRFPCSSCDGQGRRRCPGCRGNGEIECPTCRGHQRLAFAVKVKCEWRTSSADFIEEKTDLPDELVRDVSGKVIFSEEDESVSPIQNFPFAAVNEASGRLVADTDKQLKGQRKIRQRHSLRGVPVTECHYRHGGREDVFFVYGFENKLFIEQFPRLNCCCAL